MTMTDAAATSADRGTAEDMPHDRAQADKLVAEGKKAIALKDWELAVEKYADALDIMRELVGEFDPVMAPLLLSYGKALYELAFSTQGVMGKEEVEKTALAPGQEDAAPAGSSANFVFSGDSEDDEVEDDEAAAEPNAEAGPSGSTRENVKTNGEEGESGAEGQEEGPEEPEDDYNAAWEILDVARTIYAKVVEGHADGQGREDRLCLAECYLALGDVSLETENFPQAAQDYTEALAIKSKLLSPSSRALASVHYQLATVLEFTPNRRADALTHVQHAVGGFKARLAELSGAQPLSDELAKMSDKEKENEKKDVEALIGDLEVKIEELKAAPDASDPVSESIKHLLGGGSEGAFARAGEGSSSSLPLPPPSGPVNDLTSMVKKKKKVAPVPAVEETSKGKEVENGEKRKLEPSDGGEDAKKARVE